MVGRLLTKMGYRTPFCGAANLSEKYLARYGASQKLRVIFFCRGLFSQRGAIRLENEGKGEGGGDGGGGRLGTGKGTCKSMRMRLSRLPCIKLPFSSSPKTEQVERATH